MQQGIHYGIPAHVYHNADAVSASALDDMERSAAYARAQQLTYRAPTAAMEWGTAVHCAVLEPDQLAKRYTEDPQHPDGGYPAGWRNTKDYRAQKSALVAQGFGLLTPDQLDHLDVIQQNVAANPVAALIAKAQGGAEVSVYAEDVMFGLWRKCRPDLLIPDAGMVVDVKVSADISAHGFARACSTYNYHRRAAFYLDTLKMVSDVKWAHYLFLVVASDLPYEVRAFTLDVDSIELGTEEYLFLMERYAQCREASAWPLGGESIEEVRLPQYRFNRAEEF